MAKTKIVLDADVIINYFNAKFLHILPEIFPECEYVILSEVYNEIAKNKTTKEYLDKTIAYFNNIKELQYCRTEEEDKEFAKLIKSKRKGGLQLGKGESACMVFCRFHEDVLGSSNFKDINEYCEDHNIKYLMTLDFLHYAVKKGLLTPRDWDEFVKIVLAKGGKIPECTYADYVCKVKM